MMINAHHVPSAPLSGFVKMFWYWDGYVQPHAKERLLPDGGMTMVFNLAEDRCRLYPHSDSAKCETVRGQVFSGARTKHFVVDTRDMLCTVGVQFKPGGAFPFLAMPANELAEQCVGLDDVFGYQARLIRDRLLHCATPQAMFAALEHWLLSQAAKPLQRHPAVEYASRELLHNPIAHRLSALVESVGFSQRHFNQLFAAEVGLTPKRFSRVLRFQRVIRTLGADRQVDWADLALSCGYYDQAHFVHDFKEFSGLTPQSYLDCRTAHLNHVPVV